MSRAKSKLPAASPLQSQYRRALSASVVAHARYLAAQGEKSVTQLKVIQQRAAWQAMEARKARILARLVLAGDSKSAD
jgi:formylglycine-generating enzyme required for sulfatase activity